MLKKRCTVYQKSHQKSHQNPGHPKQPVEKNAPPPGRSLPSFLALPTVQEGHGSTRHPGATRTADAVDVVVGTWTSGDGGMVGTSGVS